MYDNSHPLAIIKEVLNLKYNLVISLRHNMVQGYLIALTSAAEWKMQNLIYTSRNQNCCVHSYFQKPEMGMVVDYVFIIYRGTFLKYF